MWYLSVFINTFKCYIWVATSPVFKTNLTVQCQMYLIHSNCWDQSLTFSGLHFFWTMSNYPSSSLHCGDIWKVNEITSLTALPTLQRKSALLLLVVNIVLFQSTARLILVVPLSRWAFTGKMISLQWLAVRWARGSLTFCRHDAVVLLACVCALRC